jgi:asparagine synthase (glutamine-hydrolysing)
LSGGIDSTTNVALFGEHPGTALKTFSVGYDAAYPSNPSELSHAAAVAQQFGTEHHERKLTLEDFLGFLPEMVRLQDEPIADPVCAPLYFLSKLARDNGVVVSQVGEGADELFMGYENWRRKWKLQNWLSGGIPGAAKKLGLSAARLGGMGAKKSYEALSRNVAGQPIFWGTTEAFTGVEKNRLFSARLQSQFKGYSSWDAVSPVWDRFQSKACDRSWMNWMTFIDFSMRIPELLLMRIDKMTMGVSLEGREPFLDHKLVEFVLGLPEEAKIGGGELKALMKRTVRGVIPDAVIDRPKQGFGVPLLEWFMGKLGEQAHETVSEFCKQTDFLDGHAIDSSLGVSRDPRLWYLYNFAMWWNTYIK